MPEDPAPYGPEQPGPQSDFESQYRRVRGLSQKMLAETLRVQQPAIAKLEQRMDMYISILRSHIEAMGGELEITVRFPKGTVKIANFSPEFCAKRENRAAGRASDRPASGQRSAFSFTIRNGL